MENALGLKDECERATDVDFRRVFENEAKLLYGLALLLTANDHIAHWCLSRAFNDCLSSHSVFREWALSWSKRAVIKNAILLMAPRGNGDHDPGREYESSQTKTGSVLAQTVLELELFRRFALVMSVLEGYGDKECGILLHRPAQEVAKARNEALRQLATKVGSRPAAALLTNALETFSAQLLPFLSEAKGSRGEDDGAGVFAETKRKPLSLQFSSTPEQYLDNNNPLLSRVY